MKIYSDTAITRQEITDNISQIDIKQTTQIKRLRVYVAVSFVANVALSVGLYLFR